MNFLSPAQIANLAVDWLKNAQWDREEMGVENAFDRVVRYEATDLERALEDLIGSTERLAIVVPTGSTWEVVPQKPEFNPVLRRTIGITVIVTDRMIGNRDAAINGSPADQPQDTWVPGCIRLQEIAIGALTGGLAEEMPFWRAVPLRDELIQVQRDGARQPGRAACSVDFSVMCDWTEFSPI